MADVSVANGVMTAGSTSLFGELVRVLLILLLLLPLAYFATRFYVRRMHGAGRSGALRIVEVMPLGTGRSLYVVDVAGRLLLLGVTAQQVNLITEITDPAQAERLVGMKRSPNGKDQFSDILRKVTGRADGAEGEDEID